MLVDANIILRYLLWDVEDQAKEAKRILENNEVRVSFEVMAEVVYVLEKVYKIARDKIREGILRICEYSTIEVTDTEVLKYALKEFEESNLDFVDSLLLSYNKVRKLKVSTFDKQLKKYLSKK